jgi:hypothetical protein
MHLTLVLPIVVVVLAALSCFAVDRRKKVQPEEMSMLAPPTLVEHQRIDVD